MAQSSLTYSFVGDQFLEEQLRRVRQLTEKMAQAHDQVTKNTERMSRDREAAEKDPLHRARDYGPHPSPPTRARRQRR